MSYKANVRVSKKQMAGEKRYMALKIKDWRGFKGPTITVLGSADTLAGAKKIVDQGNRSGHHAIYDQETDTRWDAYVARVYRFGGGD